MKLRIAATALLMVTTTVVAADDVRCRSRVVFPQNQLDVTIPFEKTHNGIFVRARVNGKPEPLSFVIGSGAARTLISDSAAKRILLHGTEATKLRGTDAGVIPVTVAKSVSVAIGDVTVNNIDVRIANLSALTKAWGRPVDGVIGYDLLCRAAVTVDYEKSRVTMTHPAIFKYDGNGEKLKLYIQNGWSFVQGTIKVTGRPAVMDTFLLDTGSQDAVNHPIIRDSKGPLRKVTTGPGLGLPMAGVLGPNEWFQLGKYTIGSTDSVCCGASEDASRQIGAEVLSRFRVMFDYPHHRLILERKGR